ncbi:MAG: NUDIX domain-containing protein [Labilithrix sp.]|nr:NUDIX domain-containing protein [Labilithrix sp.]
MAILPELPKVVLDVVADRSDEREGFLSLQRQELALVGAAGRGRPFRYDMVLRRALDASIMAAHHLDPSGAPCVYLRSAVRPPAALRPGAEPGEGSFWEVPAGLIEPGEAPSAAAARELEEELGFKVDASAMQPLGPSVFPAPAMIGERHYFFHVRVDPETRTEPGGDGSPLEEAAHIVSVPLERALAACKAGEVADAKTELALRRLAEIV